MGIETIGFGGIGDVATITSPSKTLAQELRTLNLIYEVKERQRKKADEIVARERIKIVEILKNAAENGGRKFLFIGGCDTDHEVEGWGKNQVVIELLRAWLESEKLKVDIIHGALKISWDSGGVSCE